MSKKPVTIKKERFSFMEEPPENEIDIKTLKNELFSMQKRLDDMENTIQSKEKKESEMSKIVAEMKVQGKKDNEQITSLKELVESHKKSENALQALVESSKKSSNEKGDYKSRTIYVGRFRDPNISQDYIRNYFNEHGEVVDVRPKHGFFFVTFDKAESASALIRKGTMMVAGQNVRIGENHRNSIGIGGHVVPYGNRSRGHVAPYSGGYGGHGNYRGNGATYNYYNITTNYYSSGDGNGGGKMQVCRSYQSRSGPYYY